MDLSEALAPALPSICVQCTASVPAQTQALLGLAFEIVQTSSNFGLSVQHRVKNYVSQTDSRRKA